LIPGFWQSAVARSSTNNKRLAQDAAVFDEQQNEHANLSLFTEGSPDSVDAVDSLQVKMSGLEPRDPLLFGSPVQRGSFSCQDESIIELPGYTTV